MNARLAGDNVRPIRLTMPYRPGRRRMYERDRDEVTRIGQAQGKPRNAAMPIPSLTNAQQAATLWASSAARTASFLRTTTLCDQRRISYDRTANFLMTVKNEHARIQLGGARNCFSCSVSMAAIHCRQAF